MKTRLFVLGFLMSLTLSVSARIFDTGERLYINMEAQSVKDAGGDLIHGWYSDGNNYNRAYFYNGSTGAWSSLVKQYSGTVWYVEAPAGEWDHVILTRHSSEAARWDNIKNQTGNIQLFYYDGGVLKIRQQNYIQNFYYGGSKEEANWEYVAPAPVGDPGFWPLAYEDEQICTDAAGTDYVLQAKNYDYENTYAHSWFKYESGSWTRLDQSEWYTVEDRDHIALHVTLGPAGSDVYYFVQCARPSMCRLVRVRLNQDCSEGAPGACKITSFAAVASEANVTDKKTAINGVVAFDDKKNAGQLQIWCPGIDTVIIDNADIKMPQTFKLEGFDASSTKNYTLYAKFLDGAGCEGSCLVKVTPPAATPTVHTTTGTAEDLRLTRFTEEDVKLTPNTQTSTYFMWTNTADLDTVRTGDRNHTFTAPADEKQITYYFLATNDPEDPEGNLISNGTFEKPVIRDDSLESKYDTWGRDNVEYYTTHPDVSGGYAITDNANTFWHEYQHVTAHEGTYFGLFDSKIYDGTDQAAWIARSGSKNPKLKVISGVSYLFSFWVANINAYYQMNNGARLQFQISYNGDAGPWHDLGNTINLSNFKDCRWHGMSSLVTPTVSSTNVVLRVINKNQSDKNIGNDFALDDIRFEAVTPNSSYIAGYEGFPVKYLKCVINSATFEQRQPIGCGTTVADVDYTVKFTHPRGDLYIYEGSTLLAHIPHSEIGDEMTSYTGVIKNQPLDNKDHVLTVYFDDGHVKTDAPTTYTYNAKNIPEISVASLTWGTVACDVPTVTLTAVINYTNQNGTLTANVDGHPANPATYTVESDDTLQVTLVIPGVTADGLGGHLLNVNFDGSHGCAIVNHAIPEDAPITPAIDTLNIQFNPLTCTDLTATLNFDLDYTYQQGAFTYWVDGMTAQSATFTPQDKSKLTLTGLSFAGIPADGKSNHVLHVSFDGPNSCVKDYVLPAVPFSPVIDNVAINGVPAGMLPCSTPSYNFNVVVTTHFDATGHNIVLNYDDNGTAQSKTVAATGGVTTIPLTLHNMDGAAQTITAALEETPACTKSAGYTPPTLARITPLFDVTVGETACGVLNYAVSGTVNYDMPDGDLIVEFDAAHRQVISVAAGSTSTNFSIPSMTATGTGLTLKAWFENSAVPACEVTSKPFDAPVVPSMDTLHVAYSPVGCSDANTTLTFDLNYTNQQGTLNYWVDAITPKQTATYSVADPLAKTLTGLAFANIPADGKTHVLHVEFSNSNSCKQTYVLPAAPFSPVIDNVAINGVPAGMLPCSTPSYNFNVVVTTHFDATGHNIVLNYDDNGTAQSKTVAATGSVTTIPLTLHNMDGAAQTITAALEETPACTKSAGYTPPTLARITPLFDVTVGETACGVLNYAVSGTVNYDMPDGDLIVEFDAAHRQVISVAPGSTSANFSITGMTATGTGLTLKAWFENSAITACEVLSKPFDAPVVPSMDTLHVAYSPVGCSDANTTLTFDLNYTNQQGTLNYWVDAITPKQTATYSVADPLAKTLTGLAFANIPADGKTHVLHVEFSNSNSCKQTYVLPAVPFSPVIDNVAINGVPAGMLPCSTPSYNFNVVVTTHFDATGHNIVLNYDDNGTAQSKTVAATGSVTTIPLTLHNMDGAAQTITAALAETPACTKSAGYTPPTLARITPLFDVTVGETACGVLNYAVSGTVNYDMPDGDLIVEFDAAHRQVISVAPGSTSANFSIPSMTATGTGLTLKAWFENSAVPACEVTSKPFDAPVVPSMDTLHVAYSPVGCSDANTTLTFDLEYIYQQGALTYRVDGLADQTATFTPKDPSKQTLAGLSFAGIPADGKAHTLHVSFDGPNSCVKDFILPAAPYAPIIDDVTVSGVPTTLPCDAESYNVAVNFNAHFTPIPADKLIVITYDSLCDTKTTAPLALTAFPYNLTLHNIANGIHTISVAFADATDCKKDYSYISPARESCECDTFVICEGGSQDWHKQTYTGPVGTHKFIDGTDTLYLFVKEHPTITVGTIAMTCDDANVVRIPFSAVKGNPDNFDIDIAGSHFAGSLDIIGTDTAFAFVPTALKAGDYSAHVTVGETGVPCTTGVDINFTIALSNYMYSKWTDVLFIGNKEGLFTSYQWIADGVPMSGETMQRLYDPKGLSGTATIYMCRLTTTDGKTLYTCPQIFDDVTPSRTVDTTPAQVKSTTMYDTMGRVIKTVPPFGIYIIVEELDNGEVRTRKITVHE